MQHMFIINSKAGSYNKNRIIEKEIASICQSHRLTYRIITSKHPALLTEEVKYFSKELKDNLTIYSVGGDGTLNNILNAMDLSSVLSVIPLGTGNDSYRTFGDSSKSLKDLITQGEYFQSDIGLVGNQRFLNISSVGFCAETNETVEQRKSISYLPNHLRYPLGAIEKIFTYTNKNITINGISGIQALTIPLTLIAICNGNYYGHGFHIAKDAKYNDGMFDIVTAQNLTKTETLAFFLRLNSSHPFESKKIKHFQSSTITLESDTEFTCNIDGETVHNKKLEFSLQPKALTLKR